MTQQLEAMKLALEALELAGGNLCESLHHPKKLQHEIGQPCPAVAKYDKAITALRQAIEQAQSYPPKCHTEADKTAFAFGWWKALESNRIEQAQKQEALDKKADNAIELGLDYEPEPIRLECVKCGTVYADGIPPKTTQKQEPVVWMNKHGVCMTAVIKEVDATAGEYTTPLYTASPQRQWVGLTHEDIFDALRPSYEQWEAVELLDSARKDYKLIEAKEKNT